MFAEDFVTFVTFVMLQNSFPVWEDFNVKAGRLHAALRLDVMCNLFLLLSLEISE